MKTKRILSVTIIIGFIITMIVIQIDRKIHERDMYESEIKGILWKIILKRGGYHYYYNKDNKIEKIEEINKYIYVVEAEPDFWDYLPKIKF